MYLKYMKKGELPATDLLPKCPQKLSYTRPESRASVWVCYRGNRDPSPLPMTCCLPGNSFIGTHLLELIYIRNNARTKLGHSDLGCTCPKW